MPLPMVSLKKFKDIDGLRWDVGPNGSSIVVRKDDGELDLRAREMRLAIELALQNSGVRGALSTRPENLIDERALDKLPKWLMEGVEYKHKPMQVVAKFKDTVPTYGNATVQVPSYEVTISSDSAYKMTTYKGKTKTMYGKNENYVVDTQDVAQGIVDKFDDPKNGGNGNGVIDPHEWPFKSKKT